jgi:hypothetical protein
MRRHLYEDDHDVLGMDVPEEYGGGGVRDFRSTRWSSRS